jgi:hypothetical protein
MYDNFVDLTYTDCKIYNGINHSKLKKDIQTCLEKNTNKLEYIHLCLKHHKTCVSKENFIKYIHDILIKFNECTLFCFTLNILININIINVSHDNSKLLEINVYSYDTTEQLKIKYMHCEVMKKIYPDLANHIAGKIF